MISRYWPTMSVLALLVAGEISGVSTGYELTHMSFGFGGRAEAHAPGQYVTLTGTIQPVVGHMVGGDYVLTSGPMAPLHGFIFASSFD